jgi:MFS family permease
MRNIPATVWRLTIAYSMMMAGTSLMVLLAGIIGTEFAPSTDLATLPIALVVVGLAASTLPTGKLLHRFGRRPVFIAYGFIAIVAALLAMQSLILGTFSGFCLAAFLMGWSGVCSAASWQRLSDPSWRCGAGGCSRQNLLGLFCCLQSAMSADLSSSVSIMIPHTDIPITGRAAAR